MSAIIKYKMLDLVVGASPPVAAFIVVTMILCSFYNYKKFCKAEPRNMAWATDSDLLSAPYAKYEDSEPDLEEALLSEYNPDYYRATQN